MNNTDRDSVTSNKRRTRFAFGTRGLLLPKKIVCVLNKRFLRPSDKARIPDVSLEKPRPPLENEDWEEAFGFVPHNFEDEHVYLMAILCLENGMDEDEVLGYRQ